MSWIGLGIDADSGSPKLEVNALTNSITAQAITLTLTYELVSHPSVTQTIQYTLTLCEFSTPSSPEDVTYSLGGSA